MAPLFKILAASTLLFFSTTSRELPNITVKKQHYTSIYSQSLEQPIEVDYEVLCNAAKSKANYNTRTGLDFYTEPGIHTSDNADYVHNDYDKGHMAPAADFNCDEVALKETFSYVNCTLQHKDLNRGLWKELEAYEKELAATHVVTIKVQIEFTKITRMPTGAAIPTGFRKTIYLEGKPFKQYWFPNQSVSGSFENFLVKKY